MLRCAQSPRSNVLPKYACARGFFARLASETSLSSLQSEFFSKLQVVTHSYFREVIKLKRRLHSLFTFVVLGLVVLSGGLSETSFAQAKPACYDLAALPLAQKNLRRSVGFVDPAPDQAKRCGTCAFYVATRNGCGTCQILSGGPTAQSAYCTSFAPKA